MRCLPKSSWFLALALLGIATTGVLAAPAPGQTTKPSETDVKAVYLEEPEPTPQPRTVSEHAISEKYPDGAVRVERRVVKLSDDQVINHGKYTEYHPNGKKFSEGNYVNGVHDGTWNFWHDNGQLAKTVVFKNGRADGSWETHRADGSLHAKKTYKDNLRDGTWVVYYEDGKTPKFEQEFVDGKADGFRKMYYANGQLRQESQYKDNMLDGLMTEFDDKGRKIAEATFTKNKLNGKLIRWGSDGKQTEQTFRDGKLVPPDAPPAAASEN
jgi:antitoxin component YwqK of YwqJK toxin-antitoxin module